MQRGGGGGREGQACARQGSSSSSTCSSSRKEQRQQRERRLRRGVPVAICAASKSPGRPRGSPNAVQLPSPCPSSSLSPATSEAQRQQWWVPRTSPSCSQRFIPHILKPFRPSPSRSSFALRGKKAHGREKGAFSEEGVVERGGSGRGGEE